LPEVIFVCHLFVCCLFSSAICLANVSAVFSSRFQYFAGSRRTGLGMDGGFFLFADVATFAPYRIIPCRSSSRRSIDRSDVCFTFAHCCLFGPFRFFLLCFDFWHASLLCLTSLRSLLLCLLAHAGDLWLFHSCSV
jgi:hypothetical protein